MIYATLFFEHWPLNLMMPSGKITEAQGEAKIARMAKAHSILAGPLWQGSDVDSGARMIKWMHRTLAFFEVGGILLEIATLIVEAVAGSILRDRMRQ